MSQLKYYYVPATCSLAAHIALREAKLDFQPIRLELKATGLPADFTAINPKRRVPVLVIDSNVITETPAIFTAISRLAPESKILGQDWLETVRVYEWANWLSGTLHGQGFGGLWRPERYTDDKTQFKALQKKAKTNVENNYREIEEKLTGDHCVGSGFTVIDAYLLVFFRWGKNIGMDMSKYPKYTSLVTTVLSRDSTKEALEAEELNVSAIL